MGRLLFFAVIAAVVYWLLKSFSSQSSGADEASERVEDMVRCVHCGIHFPRNEGILVGGKYYCSEEHRRAHADRPE